MCFPDEECDLSKKCRDKKSGTPLAEDTGTCVTNKSGVDCKLPEKTLIGKQTDELLEERTL